MTGDMADLNSTTKFEGSINNTLLYQTNLYQIEIEAKLRKVADLLKVTSPGTPDYNTLIGQQMALVNERKAHLESVYAQNPDAFFTRFKKAGQNPEPKDLMKADGTMDTMGRLIDYRSRFWDNVDFADARFLRTPVITNKLKKYIKDLTPQHPDSLNIVTDQLLQKTMAHKPYF